MTEPTDNDIKRAAEKIAKCLALTASDNPAEAGAAQRQADALMKKYNLNSSDAAASQVHEKTSKAGGKFTPPLHLTRLSVLIASAFGCESVYSSGGGFDDSVIYFIGPGIKPELAAYTFDVLRRRITNDRTVYSATLTRYKRENKIRMADLFCHAWLMGIARQVQEFAGTEQDKAAIAAYKQQRFSDGLDKDQRKSAQIKTDSDLHSIAAGANAAKDVSLHKPVQSQRGHALGHKA